MGTILLVAAAALVDVDGRVLICKRPAGKPVEYHEIRDMGHQTIYWTPEMAEGNLMAIDHYLHNGCKAGGL